MTSTDTTTEIEDVLASIRRLVSQEVEPAKPTEPQQAEDEGYLVLTPEQRISRRVAEVVAARDTTEPQSLTDELTRLESTIAELEAVVSAAREQARDDDLAEEAPFVDLSEVEDVTAEVTYLHGAKATVTEQADDAEEEDDLPEVADEQDEDPAVTDEIPETDDEDDLNDDIAPPVAQRSRTIVRGGSIADEDFDADLDDETPEITGIDEEILREMVAQMIREELRGVLGERITSNVRKLVRREIQRAFRDQLPD